LGQREQLGARASEKEPASQLEQAVLLAGAKNPAEQAKQEVAAEEAALANPAEQARQRSTSAVGAKVPGGHASHDAALEFTKVPPGQAPDKSYRREREFH